MGVATTELLKRLKLEPLCDPAIPLLGVYTQRMKTGYWLDVCALKLFKAFYSQEPRYGSNLVSVHQHLWYERCIHNRILFSHRKGKAAICDNVVGLGRHYTKWNKSGKERQILSHITYTWKSKKVKIGAPQVVQWLGLCAPNVGDQVQSLIGELAPTCPSSKFACHN